MLLCGTISQTVEKKLIHVTKCLTSSWTKLRILSQNFLTFKKIVNDFNAKEQPSDDIFFQKLGGKKEKKLFLFFVLRTFRNFLCVKFGIYFPLLNLFTFSENKYHSFFSSPVKQTDTVCFRDLAKLNLPMVVQL